MKKAIPFILFALMAAWFLSSLRPPKQEEFHYADFGRLPLLFNGRLQPMDSLARNSLLQIRDKQTANLEPWKENKDNPKIIPAIEWLATMMMNPSVADQWQIIRIENPDVVSLLKLPSTNITDMHFSWAQIEPSYPALREQAMRIADREEKKVSDASHRTQFESAVMKLHTKLEIYQRLQNTTQPLDARDWPAELAEYENLIPDGVAAARAQQAGEKFDEATLKKFAGFLERFDLMSRFEPPLLVPPDTANGNTRSNWTRVGDALLETVRGEPLPDAVRAYAAMGSALRKGDAAEFNKQVVMYRAALSPEVPGALAKADREVLFNQVEPFYKAMIIYVLAFLLGCAFWFNLSEWLRRSALWLVVLALVIHTGGLLYRMWLEGRPPVTNLYSSAIFVGWGACVLGLILEAFWKNAIGLVVSCTVGFITLIVAHNLATSGDTMEMMRAVLDNNFWLATHVVVVNLGYASTYVAGFLAIVYVIMGVFTPNLTRATPRKSDALMAPAVAMGADARAVTVVRATPAEKGEMGKSLAKMIYGIVCFATLFSFVGTVLGGIWADQSWGRFWGWDPKENGALIIVLWNAMILHLRWGGIVRERGLVVCAIFGNIVTSWSYFGVNMLGIGLHSYGFMDQAFKWLMLFIASQLALMALGLLPLRMWKSFRKTTASPSEGEKREAATTAAA
jgi:cytochrome c-type biogenesis protein CcsB